ncbi:MAG: DUF58 domain-containing protein [Bacteroidia bacterium]|nr:DUF58 domain-containing protein [Bacteroidia bacterium]
MKSFFLNIYLSNRFFIVFGAIAVLFAFAFVWSMLFPVAQALAVVGLAITIADVFLLFNPSLRMECRRDIPRVFSMGDENPVRITLRNNYGLTLGVNLVDELPKQYQERNFSLKFKLSPAEEKVTSYLLRPLTRGEYLFGKVNVFLTTFIGMVERRIPFKLEVKSAVYPSIVQMKQFELRTLARISNFHGIKKLRRIGHSYEFEQIKNYVRGDDFRSINWKATGRRGELMLNQYEDEKAQQVYCLVDNSRSMRMPFNGLSLLDHAINTSLVISNTALQKHDKAGLITFSDKIGTIIKADRGSNQLNQILEGLYAEEPKSLEANYELLYLTVRNMIRNRSLLFLYTNFESIFNLERQLPIIRRINKSHLMVVIFFENTEVSNYSRREVENLEEIYLQTIAQKFILEKNQIVQRLRQFGIQSIFTRPEDLSVNTINKYLELKARGMI